MMMRHWKALAAGLITLGVVLVFTLTPLGTIAKYRLFPNYPTNESQTLTLKGLNQEVKVYFDDFGIPHIEAQNTEDLTRAVGFLHARYRFFQLDILRHFASGRISELVGDRKALHATTVEFDLAMRGWGFQERTKIDLDALPEFDRKIILAFTDGVNQGMKQFPTVEHKILGITPKAWELEDTLLVSLLQAWSITHNWEQEAVKFALALNVGEKMAERIYSQEPLYNEGTLTTTKPGAKLPPGTVDEIRPLLPQKPVNVTYTSAIDRKINSVLGALMEIRPGASNAWVINGKRAKNGMPILSNDMHLTHSLPSLLMQQHIKTPDINAIGATMPGLPFLIGGFNGHVVWGATSAVADVTDLVVEKEDPKRPGYVLNESRDCPITKNEVIIKVRNGDSFEDRKFTMRKTCNGSVFNDMYPKFLPANAPMVAIRWDLPKVQESFGHLFRANQSKSLEDLRNNLMKIPSPIQNITAADMQGNIGFFATGSVPLREHHRGTFPVPGWLKKYEWSGWTKPEDMPYGINSNNDYFVNCNNLAFDPAKNSPVFHVEAAPEFRFKRVIERITATEKHDQSSIEDIQRDNVLLRAKLIAPILLGDLQLESEYNETENKALEFLTKWDFTSETDSVGMSIFITTYREAIIRALEPKVTPDTMHVFLKQRYSTNVVDQWFKDPMHPVWDDLNTTQMETRKSIVVSSFKKAVKNLQKKFGAKLADWNWGKLHYHHPKHMFGKKKILSFMNIDRIEHAGSLDSVWKAHFNLASDDPYKTVAGPVYRMSIDLAKPEEARFGIDTGVSGWPLSPHFDDQFEYWKQGKLIPMIHDFGVIKKKFGHRVLTLKGS
jgi:penicillin amidase